MAFDQVAYVREWRKRNVDTVHEYRRRALLKRTQETGTFPRAASIRKYGITESEIRRIVDFISLSTSTPSGSSPESRVRVCESRESRAYESGLDRFM